MQNTRVTVATLRERKATQTPITMLTAYDYTMASLLDRAKIDMILVGDSLGNVMLGYDSTIPVTVEDMIHHGRAVCRGTQYSMVVIDMPFMSYQISAEDAVRNAGRIMKETQAQAVKLEGGIEILAAVKKILAAGIPVIGHLGLTPQSVNQLGGYKVQGKDQMTAQKLMDDAKALSEAGVSAIVLECVPAKLAGTITAAISVPTLGIGAGNACDGQVLVVNDMLGLSSGFSPKFVQKFSDMNTLVLAAINDYKEQVTSRQFPAEQHTFKISDEIIEKLY